MPILNDDYLPPLLFRSKHFSTIYPSQFRKFPRPDYERTRIETPDGDFFDIDSLKKPGRQRAILLGHGLEGHSYSPYVIGMCKALEVLDADLHVMNFRTCSGEINRLRTAYNAAITEDLDLAVQWLVKQGYEEIALLGFSLSANLILNYLGRNKESLSPIPPQLKAAVAISAPVEMVQSSYVMEHGFNWIYNLRFVLKLKRKVRMKFERYPDLLDRNAFNQIKTLRQFDQTYTAPTLGFRSAEEYYKMAESRQHLHKITIPTLILTAKDDPILCDECYPYAECESNSNLHLLVTRYGGHVGFYRPGGLYYDEEKARNFIAEHFTK